LTAELNEDADAAPESLIRRVHDAVNLFTAGAPQFDDITMLCCKYYGPGNSGNTNTFKQSQVTERNENG
jgi:sigma-B regulation protein RsbU (phosphoserine phosphatase)